MKERIVDSSPNEKGERVCKICNRKLRPLSKNKDWEDRAYHVTCFRNLIQDIHRYNVTAYKKYDHKKKIGDVFVSDFVKSKDPIIITFD